MKDEGTKKMWQQDLKTKSVRQHEKKPQGILRRAFQLF